MKNRDDLPDPMFMRIHQEFYPKQGGGGSQSEPDLSPVPEFWGNGARRGPGLGRLSVLKMRIPEGCFGGQFPTLGAGTGDRIFVRAGNFFKITHNGL